MGFVSTVVIMDVDGTLTHETSVWEYLHRSIGQWESEGLPNLNAYLAGDIDYNEFARLDTLAYKGLSRQKLTTLTRRIPRRCGIETLFTGLKRLGIELGLVSTGLDILVNQFEPVDFSMCNSLEFNNDICTGRCKVNIPIDGKGEALEYILSQRYQTVDKVIVMGDSSGDIPMMERADYSIAVDPGSESVAAVADDVITGDNLGTALELIEKYLGK